MRHVSERSRNVHELAAEVTSVRAEIGRFRIELRAVFERFLDTGSATPLEDGGRACSRSGPAPMDGRSDTDTADTGDERGRCS